MNIEIPDDEIKKVIEKATWTYKYQRELEFKVREQVERKLKEFTDEIMEDKITELWFKACLEYLKRTTIRDFDHYIKSLKRAIEKHEAQKNDTYQTMP